MYGDSYGQEDGLQRFLRVITASFSLGRWFGVEVRFYYLGFILPLIMLSAVAPYAGLLGTLGLLGIVAAFSAGLYFFIYVHEMGHIAAGWRYGIPSRLITLSPLGGLAHMSAPAPHPRADIVISLAGPATHLVWLGVLAPLYYGLPALVPTTPWWLQWILGFLFWTNVSLMLFNLLPFFPMDNGRVLRAFLAMRMHPNRATVIACYVGMVGAVLIGLGGVAGSLLDLGPLGGISIAIGLTNFLACWQELIAARYQDSPYGGGDYMAPWQRDPEAWKAGDDGEWGGGAAPGAATTRPQRAARGPGRWARWVARRREEKKRELEQEVDRILVKINEVGLGGLTWRERRALNRASREARNRK